MIKVHQANIIYLKNNRLDLSIISDRLNLATQI